VGEPGVGKTRLAQEITLLARAQGFRQLTGRCYAPQQSLAYAPVLEALSQAVALVAVDAPGQAPVAERWPEVARLLPDYALRAAAPSAADERHAQQRLFAQVRRLREALLQRAPLALLLDDLHWADAASLDLLQYLARQMRDQPLLLVGTTRAVEAQRQPPLVDALRDLGHDELLEQLLLPPLAADETAALIGLTLGGADGAPGDGATISAELAARIQTRSEGNAFFARQLARALHEQGELQFSEGREAAGRQLLEEAMKRIARVGGVFLLQEPTCLLAEADLLSGLAEQARRRLSTLLDGAHPTPAEGKSRRPLLLLTWAEIALGHSADAEARLNALFADATPLFYVDALRVQGLLATQQERWDVGAEALHEATERAHTMPFPHAELMALYVCSQLEAARGDLAAARTHLKRALAICDRLGEGWYRKHVERDLRRLARKDERG
jgi:hypothetical protein